MQRRAFIMLLAGAAAWPLAARAQQPGGTRRIDVLMMYPERDPQGELRAAAFQREIEKAGWKIGGNLEVNFHWGTGDANWVRSAIAKIVDQAPDVMLGEWRCGSKSRPAIDPNCSRHFHRQWRSGQRWLGGEPSTSRRQFDRLCRHGADLGDKVARDAQTGGSAAQSCRRPDKPRQRHTSTYFCVAGGCCG